jgi:hypothetical protein
MTEQSNVILIFGSFSFCCFTQHLFPTSILFFCKQNDKAKLLYFNTVKQVKSCIENGTFEPAMEQQEQNQQVQWSSWFVSQKSKEGLKSSSGNRSEDTKDKESNAPSYDKYEDQLEEEQGEQTGGIEIVATISTTANQVF